jgi:hypothetical protein
MSWTKWIERNWEDLNAGKKLLVREDLIGHPSDRPDLFKAGTGFPDGQTCDYMMPLADKSRIHAQCYQDANGVPMLRIHRDRWDPDRDLESLVKHALFETPFGAALAGVAIVALIAR